MYSIEWDGNVSVRCRSNCIEMYDFIHVIIIYPYDPLSLLSAVQCLDPDLLFTT